ncbi:Stress-response A/B barrel domain-containing protein [Glycine soja]|nr:Stress-response A/B barrel domain-containing protein [Glycine soja]
MGPTSKACTPLHHHKNFFAAQDNDDSLHSFYVKSEKEMPYYIYVLQISAAISSADAEAPTATPSKALPSFKENVGSGLTVFCPTDSTVSGFVPKYKNLTKAQKVSLLLYQATPVYESLQMLKSSNQIMNTLTTEGVNKYDLSEGKELLAMGEFKHFVIVKFKEGVAVDDLTKGMEKLVSEIHAVKSFEWGQDIESLDVLRQGFTHAFLMTFNKKEDFVAFQSHPNHVEFSTKFSAAIENIVLLDFPSTLVKAPA